MTKRDISARLPEEAEESFRGTVFAELREGLGGDYLIFSRVPHVFDTAEWDEIMTPGDMRDYERSGKHCWAADCTCTACGSEWLSGWVGGGEILMYQDEEDTCTYPGIPELGEPGTIFVGEDDEVLCPYCEAPIRGVKKANIRSGRTFQALICRVEHVEETTILMYWLARRRVDLRGSHEELLPGFALALEEDGSLTLYTHMKGDGMGRMTPGRKWERRTEARDPDYYKYYSWDALMHNVKGSYMWAYGVPDMAGETGEKTGLKEYIEAGGGWPAQYLAAWRKRRTLENAVKAGFGKIVAECIEKEATRSMEQGWTLFGPKEISMLFDWTSPRPCDMVDMTPDMCRKAPKWGWDMDTLLLWREAVNFGIAHPADAEIFHGYLVEYGFAAMNRFVGTVTDGWDYTMDEIDRYLGRQLRRHALPLRTGMNMLFDYHGWLYEDREDEPTPAELWPNDLRYAHDTLNEKRRLGDAKKYAKQFAEALRKWSALEWTDGELCAVLPRTNADLVDEGRTLNHCVGGYGKDHVEGRLIIFIRHCRRPERSFFTLNIDTTGKTPREIQLHGYGNEWAHGKKLNIPRKVREFCDRWEKEILPGVFREVKAAEAAGKRTRQDKKKTKEAAA